MGIVVIGIAVTAAFAQPKNKTRTSVPEAKTNSSSTVQGQQNVNRLPGKYTIAQVAAHKDASSCWSAVNGGVHDLTAWIAQHPGGENAILSICGKDGTDAFNNQHGGKEKQETILQTFKIGELVP